MQLDVRAQRGCATMGAHLPAEGRWAWHHILCAIIALTGGFIHLINTGTIQIPLPYPGVNQYVHLYPDDVWPWQPRPSEGVFTSNTRLRATRLFQGQVDGSESVIVSPEGVATMLDKFGAVHEAIEGPDGSFELNPKPRAWLGPGRPLGAAFDADGNLYVCDALKGLLMLPQGSGQVELVANRVSSSSPLEPGEPIIYANDMDIAPDGMVYFTSSNDVVLIRNAPHDSRFTHVPSLEGRAGFWDTIKGWGIGMCQGLPQGKVYSYNPATKETHLLARGFFYSNGIAVSEDGSYLVLSETDRLRLLKIWLKGAKAGQIEVMISHLPGTPDGVARAPDGNFWTALLVKPPKATKAFHLPIVRSILPLMDERIRPQVADWGAVFKVSPDGDVLEYLEDPQRPKGQGLPSAYRISSAHEHNGKLWLGALSANFVSYVELDKLPPKTAEAPVTFVPLARCKTPPCQYVTHYH